MTLVCLALALHGAEQSSRAPFRGARSRACSCRPQAGSCAVALPKADRPRCQNDARRRSKAFKPARLSGIANGATRRTARRLAFVVARQRIYIYCNICTIWKCQQFTASLHKSLATPHDTPLTSATRFSYNVQYRRCGWNACGGDWDKSAVGICACRASGVDL